ncbi:MAG: metal ABC transporter permease, partial [Methylocella sp.]
LTERTLQKILKRHAETRIVIVVAHRHATIEHADHVIVLNGGKLVEQGPPQALLRADGLFTAMFTKSRPPVKHGYAEP